VAGSDCVSGRAELLCSKLSEQGLVIDLSAARGIILKRLEELSGQRGITDLAALRHLTDDAIQDLADAMASAKAPEGPRVDLLTAPRSVALPNNLLGRAVSGLAEAILFFQRNPEIPTSSDRIRRLAELLSIVGAVIAGSPSSPVYVPPELLGRVAGRLEAAATYAHAPDELAAAWRRDATRLRAGT